MNLFNNNTSQNYTNCGRFTLSNGGSDTTRNLYSFVTLTLVLIFILPSFAHANSGYHVSSNYDLVANDKKNTSKVILITIDDGPSKYSRGMADTLIKHKAKAIFFINGTHDKDNPGNIAYEAKLGFTIGNHTWDHPNLKLVKSNDKIKKEIDDDIALITKITGSAPKFFRSPFGVSSTYSRELVKKENMLSMTWSGAAKDWEKSARDEKVFMKNITGPLHPGEILLIHEHEWTAKYLDDLLTTLADKGYTFADPSDITN